MMVKRKPLSLFFLMCGLFCAGQVDAHASEQGLVLLLPTGAYAAAGTLTVIASILLVTCLPKNALSILFQALPLPLPLDRAKGKNAQRVSLATSLCATILFLILVFIGFRGPTDPQNNLLPLTIWTVWWIGVFVVQGMVFDVWKWVNPWTGFLNVLNLGENPIVRIPEKLGAWPAVVILVFFNCFYLQISPQVTPKGLQLLCSAIGFSPLSGLSCAAEILGCGKSSVFPSCSV